MSLPIKQKQNIFIQYLSSFKQSVDNHPYAPYIYIILQAIFVSFVQVLVKQEKQFSIFQILQFRGLILFLVNYRPSTKNLEQLYPKNKKTHKLIMQRTVLQAFTVCMQFGSCQFIDLSTATILWLTNPLWTQIVSTLFYGKKYNKKVTLYIFITFIGILTIFQPKFLFGNKNNNDENNTDNESYKTLLGQSLALGGSICFSFLACITRELKGRTKPLIVLQYLYGGNVLLMSVAISVLGKIDTSMYFEKDHLINIFFISISSFIGQYCIQQAMMKGEPQKVVPVMQIQVIFSILFDIILFNNSIQTVTIIGCLIIISSCYKVITIKD